MKIKIKCYSKKEALKLYKMLNQFTQKEYMEEGEIEQDGRNVIFKINYHGGMRAR